MSDIKGTKKRVVTGPGEGDTYDVTVIDRLSDINGVVYNLVVLDDDLAAEADTQPSLRFMTLYLMKERAEDITL